MGELVGQFGLLPTTAAGALLFIALLVIVGVYPTPGELRRTRADRDHYRQAADELAAAVLKQGITLERLLEYAETSEYALREITAAVVQHRQGRP